MSSSWELFNEIEVLLDECLKLETTTPSPLTRAVPRMGTSVQRSDVQNRHQAEFLVSSPPSPPKVRKEQPTAVPTNAVRPLPAVATWPPPAVATQPTPAAATQPTPAAVAPPAPAAASPAPATASRPPPPPPAAYSRPTLPSPIMVEYAPGQFAPIPYFSAVISRRYKLRTAEGKRYKLRFSREGRLLMSRPLPQQASGFPRRGAM